MPARRPGPVPDRWKSVEIRIDTGCWEWCGYRMPKTGYGTLWVAHATGRKSVLAHIAFYESLKGPIPEGLEIDHLCRNRACVNPLHMEPVTHVENMRRGHAYRLAHGGTNKTHCIRGHLLTDENSYVKKRQSLNGEVTWRTCRECFRSRRAERAEGSCGLNPPNTHCKQGHLLEGDNLGRNGNGDWYCRPCNRDANARWRARRKQRDLAS